MLFPMNSMTACSFPPTRAPSSSPGSSRKSPQEIQWFPPTQCITVPAGIRHPGWNAGLSGGLLPWILPSTAKHRVWRMLPEKSCRMLWFAVLKRNFSRGSLAMVCCSWTSWTLTPTTYTTTLSHFNLSAASWTSSLHSPSVTRITIWGTPSLPGCQLPQSSSWSWWTPGHSLCLCPLSGRAGSESASGPHSSGDAGAAESPGRLCHYTAQVPLGPGRCWCPALRQWSERGSSPSGSSGARCWLSWQCLPGLPLCKLQETTKGIGSAVFTPKCFKPKELVSRKGDQWQEPTGGDPQTPYMTVYSKKWQHPLDLPFPPLIMLWGFCPASILKFTWTISGTTLQRKTLCVNAARHAKKGAVLFPVGVNLVSRSVLAPTGQKAEYSPCSMTHLIAAPPPRSPVTCLSLTSWRLNCLLCSTDAFILALLSQGLF